MQDDSVRFLVTLSDDATNNEAALLVRHQGFLAHVLMYDCWPDWVLLRFGAWVVEDVRIIRPGSMAETSFAELYSVGDLLTIHGIPFAKKIRKVNA